MRLKFTLDEVISNHYSKFMNLNCGDIRLNFQIIAQQKPRLLTRSNTWHLNLTSYVYKIKTFLHQRLVVWLTRKKSDLWSNQRQIYSVLNSVSISRRHTFFDRLKFLQSFTLCEVSWFCRFYLIQLKFVKSEICLWPMRCEEENENDLSNIA